MTDNNLVSSDSTTGQNVDLQAMHAQAMANAEEAAKPSKFVSGYTSSGPSSKATDADFMVDLASTKVIGSKFVAAGVQLAGTMSRNGGFTMGAQKDKKQQNNMGSMMPMGYWDKRRQMKADRKAAAKEWRKNKGRPAKGAKTEGIVSRAAIASQSVNGSAAGKGAVKGAKVTAKTVKLCGTAQSYISLAAAIKRRMDAGEMGTIRHDSKKLPNSALNAYKQGNDKLDKHLKNFVPDINPSLSAKKPRF